MKRFLALVSRYDWALFGAGFLLVMFGLAAIYSVALSTETGDLGFVYKQLIAIGLGLGIVSLLSFSNYHTFRNWSSFVYLLSLLLLVGVLIFGTTVRGTTGWYTVAGFSFQPVEFAKVALILILAKYFSERARRDFGWKEVFASGGLTLVPAGLVMLQPDFGSASVLIGIWVISMFFAGLKPRHAAVLGVVVVSVAALSWFFVFQDYQQDRILTFLDPSRDPLGRGYNVTQATIAIGSGQMFGRGLGFGSQSQLKFLPESQTDFIFAVIAEELGFFGVSFILFAFGLFFWRVVRSYI